MAHQCIATTSVAPVEPADETSRRVENPCPANVWSAASASKSAHALETMRREGLPVLVLANCRGFAGGATDMYGAVLTHGAAIVETLVSDGPPVWVYLTPHGQLRGGAFVVLAPSLNPSRIRLNAAPTAAAGILEPSAQAAYMWKVEKGGANPIGEHLARLQDVPERLVHQGIAESIVPWSEWRDVLQQRLTAHYLNESINPNPNPN